MPLIFDPAGLNAFAIPKSIASQALGLTVTGILIAMYLRFGRIASQRTMLHLAVAGLVGVYLAASAFALNGTVAILGSSDDAAGLATLIDGAVLFLAIATLIQTRWDATVLASALFLPLVPVVGYELVQKAGADPVPWISDIGRVRPFSTFGNADVLGHYLGTLAIGASALAVLHKWPDWKYVALSAATAALALGGTLMTATRAVVPGLVAAGAVLIVVALRQRAGGGRSRRAVLAVSLAGFATLAVIALSPVGQRFVGFAASISRIQEGGPIEGSIAGRLVLYEAALAQISARPLLGVGPGNFVAAYPGSRPAGAYEALQTNAIENSPHNWLLKVGTDAGVLGLAAYVATLIGAAALATAAPAAVSAFAMAALLALVYLLGAGMFTVNDAGTEWLYWTCLGIIAATVRARVDDSDSPRTDRRDRGRGWALIPLALGLVALFAAANALEAGRAAGENYRARISGSLPRSIAAGERAVSRASYRAEYWHGLGLSFAVASDFPKARTAFQRAVDLAPHHTTYVTNLARAQASIGRQGDSGMLQAAVATAHTAVSQDPRNVEAYVALTIVGQAAGRSAESVTAAESALRIGPEPTDINFYAAAGEGYLSMNRVEDAERVVRLGLARSPNVPTGRTLHLLLARVLHQTGRRGEAIAEIDKVLAVLPNDRSAQELRRQIVMQ